MADEKKAPLDLSMFDMWDTKFGAKGQSQAHGEPPPSQSKTFNPGGGGSGPEDFATLLGLSKDNENARMFLSSLLQQKRPGGAGATDLARSFSMDQGLTAGMSGFDNPLKAFKRKQDLEIEQERMQALQNAKGGFRTSGLSQAPRREPIPYRTMQLMEEMERGRLTRDNVAFRASQAKDARNSEYAKAYEMRQQEIFDKLNRLLGGIGKGDLK